MIESAPHPSPEQSADAFFGRSGFASRPFIILVIAFLFLVFPVIVWGLDNTAQSYDQNHHHLVVIRQATASLTGATDSTPIWTLLRDYPSATSPGYHLFLAGFDAIGLGNVVTLRLISSLFGLGLLITVWSILRRRIDDWTALCFVAPLLCSPYFLSGSIWLTTDVPAIGFVTLALGSLLFVEPSSAQRMRSGIFSALAILVRQPTVWLIAPIFLSGLIGRQRRMWDRSRNEWLCFLCSIALPLIVLGWLIALWGGIMPPAYRTLHNAGANLAMPAFALSLLALWGLPWTIASGALSIFRSASEMRWMILGAVLGILCATLTPTTFDQSAGRWAGPLWGVVALAPSIGQRSVIFLILAPIGGIFLAAILRSAVRNAQTYGAAVLGVSCAAMLGALTVNTQCWERYVDLPMLALLPLMVVLGLRPTDHTQQRRVRISCAVLTVAQLGLSLWMVYYRSTFMA